MDSRISRSELPTDLHEERLFAVIQVLLERGARRILDLGCGEGALIAELVRHPEFEQITGVDISSRAISEARHLLTGLMNSKHVTLIQTSFEETDERLHDYDAAVLLETIEHIDPKRLSVVEAAVFSDYKPSAVLITTPNADHNVVHGLRKGKFRHHDHRFEWGRDKFRAWSQGVAQRQGYSVTFSDIGELHPIHGSSTQMAVFTRLRDR